MVSPRIQSAGLGLPIVARCTMRSSRALPAAAARRRGRFVAAHHRHGGSFAFDVEFGNGATFRLDYDQIDLTFPNTPDATKEAELWKAGRQLKVFLCHGSEDKAAVRDVYERLRVAGMRPWLDEVDIQPGEDWDDAIRLVEGTGRERLLSRLRELALERLPK